MPGEIPVRTQFWTVILIFQGPLRVNVSTAVR